MTVLVLGATGATGRLFVKELLNRDCDVKAIARSGKIPGLTPDEEKKLTILEAPVLDLSQEELDGFMADCDAVASCLGHNMTFKGLFGHPRKLVTEAVRRSCKALEKSHPDKAARFVLMNTTGNPNRDLREHRSFAHILLLGLMRLTLPPLSDNEQAADFLRLYHPDKGNVEWSAVRPDSLIDEDAPSAYTLHPSPIRDPLFNPGKTSRINVAHFMADLVTDESVWKEWKGKMPVIYNS